MKSISEIYTELCDKISDINEHLPVLKKYTEECETITEMGVRYCVSTYSFLAGNPKKLTSIDIIHPSEWGGDLSIVEKLAKESNIEFEFILANTLEVNITNTDLLFIDTWHAYQQLKDELNRHHSKVNKYIILHDTTLFAFHDETTYESWGWKGINKGIWPAVEEFLEENKNWTLYERYTNNNGLTILKRN